MNLNDISSLFYDSFELCKKYKQKPHIRADDLMNDAGELITKYSNPVASLFIEDTVEMIMRYVME